MGHLSSLSKHVRGIAQAIASISSSIVDHVMLKRYRENKDSEEDDDDLDSLDIDPFDAVLERVKVKHIGKHVAAIRANIQPSDKKNIPVVEVGSHTLCGEDVFYTVKFADGVKWMLKVPAIGTPDQFDEDDAEALRSEALTMIMLRHETTIPIPKVFSYDNTCKNKLKVPFILMEFIDGRPLIEAWHDRESPKEVVQARRTRCLQDIAAAYLQLAKYTLNKNKPLRFDDQDRLIGVVPVKEDPFSGLKVAYTSRLDRWGKDEFVLQKELLKLLRMFADWTPEPIAGKSFVVTHPNPNIFNFLVSDDGSVRAILDWHGAEAEPPSIGNEAYPLWLMRYWDPTVYGWTEEMEHEVEDEDWVWEDSPDTLEFYRNVYAQCIANLRPESKNARLTRNSPLFQHLMMAMGGSMFSLGRARKILDEVMKRVVKNGDDNSWPLNPSNNDKKDDNDSENHSSAKENDATGHDNSPKETEDKAEHGGIEADIDEEHLVDIRGFLEALDKDGLCEHQEKLLKAGFHALFS
ncbi:Aminoglycoside phosphotransferase [Penicillium cf. viridicatum]|uniref:Aminoglycoside phosphotransferase n=1 Tax=Penicillium cf. viridicatum TaxID=2972119 RepID=A0A9W9M7J3_9EURO|nr:Aminoglycoside phosphotransferase [Penicillium cf. viridicatum]